MTKHIDIVTQIREFLAASHSREGFTADEIALAIDQPVDFTRITLMRMDKDGVCVLTNSRLGPRYHKALPFKARQITPLFANTPDWVVEVADGRLICWAPGEFEARLIADALCRS